MRKIDGPPLARSKNLGIRAWWVFKPSPAEERRALRALCALWRFARRVREAGPCWAQARISTPARGADTDVVASLLAPLN